MEIGDIINKQRTKLGLTLEEVGIATGVSKSTVKKWESGFIANMRRDKIASLAKILRISPVVLIYGEEHSEETQPNEKNTIIDSRLHTLVENYNQLSELGKIKLFDYSNDLVSSSNYMETQKEKHA